MTDSNKGFKNPDCLNANHHTIRAWNNRYVTAVYCAQNNGAQHITM